MGKATGAPAITPKLRELLEGEFKKYGYTGGDGRRHLPLSMSFRILSTLLNVSEGTVKNGLAALKAEGFIIRQEHGLYLVLVNADSPCCKGQPQARKEPSDDEPETEDAEARRLSQEMVMSIIRDLIVNSTRAEAIAYMDAHRSWCWQNGLTPHV